MSHPSMSDLLTRTRDDGPAEVPSGAAAGDAATRASDRPAPGATVVVEGATGEEALAELHARLGVTAQVVEARKVHRGGIGGFFAREAVQLHAAPGDASDPAADARPSTSPHRSPVDRLVSATGDDVVDFASFLRGQFDADAGVASGAGGDDGSADRSALIARATAAARAAAAGADAIGRVVDPHADVDHDPSAAADEIHHLDTAAAERAITERAITERAVHERAADERAVAERAVHERGAAERAAAAARLSERGVDAARDHDADEHASVRARAAAARLARRCGAAAEAPDACLRGEDPWTPEPPATSDQGPAWSVGNLIALGLPTELVRALAVGEPHDDLAWTTALAVALRPLCRPLPSEPTVLVGPRAGDLAAELQLAQVELSTRLRSATSTVALVTGGSQEALDQLEVVAQTHGFHLVIGGRGWRRLAHLRPGAVSWTAPEHVGEAIRLAAELGLVLGYGRCGTEVERAAPLELALTVRDLLPVR